MSDETTNYKQSKEAVALELFRLITAHDRKINVELTGGTFDKEAILNLYRECLDKVMGLRAKATA